MKNRIVVYTAITKDYDDFRDPKFVSNQCDYVCFTDDPNLTSTIWDFKPFPPIHLDQIRQCRKLKIMAHQFLPEFDYSIWVDGNLAIIGNIDELIDQCFVQGKHEFYTFKHPWRDCIYKEAKECNKQGKDSEKIIRKQMKLYRAKNYPENNGLIESNVLFRSHHSSAVMKIMEQWWNEVSNYSRRDQLSFNYIAWKNNFHYGYLPGNSRGESNYFLHRYEHIVKDINQINHGTHFTRE